MLFNYIKIAFKVLQRRKFFTFVSLFGTGFTLMVLVVGVSFYENTYRPHAPESDGEDLLHAHRARWRNTEADRTWSTSVGYQFLDKQLRNIKNVEKLAIHARKEGVVAYRDGIKLEVDVKYTDPAFWEVFDFTFLEGGPYSQTDMDNKNMVLVINRDFRERYFGQGEAVGQTVRVDGRGFRVVGVVENVPAYRKFPFADIWSPIPNSRRNILEQDTLGNMIGTVRMADGADPEQIKDDFYAAQATATPPREGFDEYTVLIHSYWELWARDLNSFRHHWSRDGGLSDAVTKAILGILLFMLLPAVNMININISRVMERGAEIGVRKSFGATSNDLALQFIIENLILTLLGGLLGLIGATLVIAGINSSNLFAYAALHINLSVFALSVGLMFVFAMLSGVFPAWRMARMNPVDAIKGGI